MTRLATAILAALVAEAVEEIVREATAWREREERRDTPITL